MGHVHGHVAALAKVLLGVPLEAPLALDPGTSVDRVVVDSREAGPGALFVARRGVHDDGHRFVEAALAAGAVAALVAPGRVARDLRVLETPDPEGALATVAANVCERPAEALRIAGVTGTNGKTTVAHVCGQLLQACGERIVRLGTCGDLVVDEVLPASFTTPFPPVLHERLRAGLERKATCAVLEVSSHALDQRRVAEVPFAAVALSNFGRDHLDYHGDEASYLAAKLRLAGEHLVPGGLAVAATSAGEAARRFLEAARGRTDRAWTCGTLPGATIRAEDVRYGPDGTSWTLVTPMGRRPVRAGLVGPYNVDNVLVAVGLALGLGMPFSKVAAAVERVTAPPGRLERVQVPGVAGPRVYVDYAHTPDAVARVLGAVRPHVAGRLFVVLGCGGDRDAGKRPVMGQVAAEGADRLYATSDNPRTEDPERILDAMVAGVSPHRRAAVVRRVDRGRAIAEAIADANEEDTVLVLGKGHETTQDLGDRVVPFDDREHARAALARRSAHATSGTGEPR